jgi:hypothetical protein
VHPGPYYDEGFDDQGNASGQGGNGADDHGEHTQDFSPIGLRFCFFEQCQDITDNGKNDTDDNEYDACRDHEFLPLFGR